MDEEWARRIVDAELQGQDVAPAADPEQLGPLGYTPQLSYLALIADRLDLLRNTLVAVNSEGGEPPFQPLPRPTTAIARERDRRARDELLEIDRLLRGV